MIRYAFKIIVGREHGQTVMDAKLRQQRVYRADLRTRTSTRITQFRCLDVVVAIRNKERNRGKPVQDLSAGARARKALQKLLQHKPGRQNGLTGFDRANQSTRLRRLRRRIAPQRKRPYAGVDE
jgi:hypothetical protein